MHTNQPNTFNTASPSSSSPAASSSLASGARSTSGGAVGAGTRAGGTKAMNYNPFSFMDVDGSKNAPGQPFGGAATMPKEQEQHSGPTASPVGTGGNPTPQTLLPGCQQQERFSQLQQPAKPTLDLSRTCVAVQSPGNVVAPLPRRDAAPALPEKVLEAPSHTVVSKARGTSVETVISTCSGTEGDGCGRSGRRRPALSSFLKKDPPDFLKPSSNALLHRQPSGSKGTVRGLADQSRSGSTAPASDAQAKHPPPPHQHQQQNSFPSPGNSPGFVLHTARERDRTRPLCDGQTALTARPRTEGVAAPIASNEHRTFAPPSSVIQEGAPQLPQAPPQTESNSVTVEPYDIRGSNPATASTAAEAHLSFGSCTGVCGFDPVTRSCPVPPMDVAPGPRVEDTAPSSTLVPPLSLGSDYAVSPANFASHEIRTDSNNTLSGGLALSGHLAHTSVVMPGVGSIAFADDVFSGYGGAPDAPEATEAVPSVGQVLVGERRESVVPHHATTPAAPQGSNLGGAISRGPDAGVPRVAPFAHNQNLPPPDGHCKPEGDARALCHVFDAHTVSPSVVPCGSDTEGFFLQERQTDSLLDVSHTAHPVAVSEPLSSVSQSRAHVEGMNIYSSEQGASPEARRPLPDKGPLALAQDEVVTNGQQCRLRAGAVRFAMFSSTGYVLVVSNVPSSRSEPSFVYRPVADVLTGKVQCVSSSKVGWDRVEALRSSVTCSLAAGNERRAALASLRNAVQQMPGMLPLLRDVLSHVLRDSPPAWREGGQRELMEMLTAAAKEVSATAVVNPYRLSGSDLVRVDRNEALLEVQRLLLEGQREAAVDAAMKHQLYTHALIISMVCPSKEQYMNVMSTIVHEELNPFCPLAHAYCMFNELPLPAFAPAKEVRDRGEVDIRQQWVQHATMFVSNFTSKSAEGLVQLGDTLMTEGLIDEAYCCFLLAHLTPMGCVAPQKTPQPQQQHVINLLRERLGALNEGCHPSRTHVVLTPKLMLLAAALEGGASLLDGESDDMITRHGLPTYPVGTRVAFYCLQVLWLRELGLQEVADRLIEYTRQMALAVPKGSLSPAVNHLLGSESTSPAPFPSPATGTDTVFTPRTIPPRTVPSTACPLNCEVSTRPGVQPPQSMLPKRRPDVPPPTTVRGTPSVVPQVSQLTVGQPSGVARGDQAMRPSMVPPPPRPASQTAAAGAVPAPPPPTQAKALSGVAAMKFEPPPPGAVRPSAAPPSIAPPAVSECCSDEFGSAQDPCSKEEERQQPQQQKQQPQRAGSLGAIANFIFRRGGPKDSEAKKHEPKKMIIDTQKPPKFDPDKGCYLFPESEEDKKVAEMIKAGPVARYSVMQQAPQGGTNRRVPMRTKYVDSFNST